MEARSLAFEEKLKESFANIDRTFEKAISELKPKRELQGQKLEERKKRQQLEKEEESEELEKKDNQKCGEEQPPINESSTSKAEAEYEEMHSVLGRMAEGGCLEENAKHGGGGELCVANSGGRIMKKGESGGSLASGDFEYFGDGRRAGKFASFSCGGYSENVGGGLDGLPQLSGRGGEFAKGGDGASGSGGRPGNFVNGGGKPGINAPGGVDGRICGGGGSAGGLEDVIGGLKLRREGANGEVTDFSGQFACFSGGLVECLAGAETGHGDERRKDSESTSSHGALGGEIWGSRVKSGEAPWGGRGVYDGGGFFGRFGDRGGGFVEVGSGGSRSAGGGGNGEGRVVGCGSGGGPGSVVGVEIEVGSTIKNNLENDVGGRYKEGLTGSWFGLQRKELLEYNSKGSLVKGMLDDLENNFSRLWARSTNRQELQFLPQIKKDMQKVGPVSFKPNYWGGFTRSETNYPLATNPICCTPPSQPTYVSTQNPLTIFCPLKALTSKPNSEITHVQPIPSTNFLSPHFSTVHFYLTSPHTTFSISTQLFKLQSLFPPLQWLTMEIKHDNNHLSRGRKFNANYDPP